MGRKSNGVAWMSGRSGEGELGDRDLTRERNWRRDLMRGEVHAPRQRS
jgi:hypothetical protein